MNRYLVLSRDGKTADNVFLKQLIRKHQIGSEVVHEDVLRDSRDYALIQVLKHDRVKSVLVVGADTFKLFRPDLSISKVQGVPMVLNYTVGKTPVVGVPVVHPKIAHKVKELYAQFEDAVEQWVWRGQNDPTDRWPGECVKCGRDGEKYDYMGVCWCPDEFPGYEPPVHVKQERLLP